MLNIVNIYTEGILKEWTEIDAGSLSLYQRTFKWSGNLWTLLVMRDFRFRGYPIRDLPWHLCEYY